MCITFGVLHELFLGNSIFVLFNRKTVLSRKGTVVLQIKILIFVVVLSVVTVSSPVMPTMSGIGSDRSTSALKVEGEKTVLWEL